MAMLLRRLLREQGAKPRGVAAAVPWGMPVPLTRPRGAPQIAGVPLAQDPGLDRMLRAGMNARAWKEAQDGAKA